MIKMYFLYFVISKHWRGLLHHTVNQHEWLLGDGVGAGKCGHGPISEEDIEKPYLVPESPSHEKLRTVILSQIFVSNVKYYVNFR